MAHFLEDSVGVDWGNDAVAHHQFDKQHFSRPTWCDSCKHFIWGIGKQGQVCRRCKLAVHHACAAALRQQPCNAGVGAAAQDALHPLAALTLLPGSLMSGWLHVSHQGKKPVKLWAILLLDDDDAAPVLRFYKKKNSRQPVLSLPAASLQKGADSCLLDLSVDGHASCSLQADSSAEAQMWINTVRHASSSAPSSSSSSSSSPLSTPSPSSPRAPPSDVQPLVSLDVQVIETRNVRFEVTPLGVNSYVLLKLLQFEQQTTIQWRSSEPTWLESFTFESSDASIVDSTSLICYLTQQRTFGAGIPLGHATVPLSTLVDEQTHCEWYPLVDAGKESVVTGTLQLELIYAPPQLLPDVDDVGDTAVPGQLHVNVLSGSGLAPRDRNGLADPYVVLELGGDRKKTKVKRNTLTPFWDQTFSFTVLPAQRDQCLRVSVFDRDFLGSSDFMGQTTVALADLPVKQPWLHDFVLFPRATSTSSSSSSSASSSSQPALRLKLQLCVRLVLPERCYAELTALLLNDGDKRLLRLVGDVVQRKEPLAVNLVKIFYRNNMLFRLVSYLIESEIRSTADPEILFRGNSLTTKVVDSVQKLFGDRLLQATLRPIVDKIGQLKKPVELDPSRIGKDTSTKSLETVVQLCQELLDALWASVELLPPALNRTYSLLKQEIDARFGARYSGSELRRFRSIAISSFFFLRLICPAVLSPALFGLSGAAAQSEIAARTLTLVAKTIQTLANFASFGAKEPHMVPLNSFIEINTERMHALLDRLAQGPAPTAAAASASGDGDAATPRRKASLLSMVHVNSSSSLITADPTLSFSYERELAIFLSFCREAKQAAAARPDPAHPPELLDELERIVSSIDAEQSGI